MPDYAPIAAPEIREIDSSASPAEQFWKRVPIVGWMIADRMWGIRTTPIVAKIERQMKERERPDSSIWGSDLPRRELAEWLCRQIADQMEWPNDYYIPDDPIEVLLWAHDYDLDVGAVVQMIEKRLRIKLTVDEVSAWFDGQTLGSVVDYLLTKWLP